MRKHTFSTAVMTCAVAGLVASTGAVSAAPSAMSPVGHVGNVVHTARNQFVGPALVDCFGHAQKRPDSFILACGDGNSRLLELHWTHWGTNSATAEGVNAVNDCEPYCAVGQFRPYPVVVRLDHPESWTKHPQLQRFSRMSLIYTDSRPGGRTGVVTYSLWN